MLLAWVSKLTTSQGGFARVYEVSDENHVHHAVKVVAKVNLQSKKSKTKVRSIFPRTCPYPMKAHIAIASSTQKSGFIAH
jgi:hypothetical protein